MIPPHTQTPIAEWTRQRMFAVHALTKITIIVDCDFYELALFTIAHKEEVVIVLGAPADPHNAEGWLCSRGGDEASTQFFRCTKCGATWRDSS